MTLKEIEAIPKEMLTAAQVAPILNADPNSIRLQAHLDPDALGFPVVVHGSRVKIPKRAFLRFIQYGKPQMISERRV